MLGVIARADNSGLATQTWEMCRHTRPGKILLVHLEGDHRGPYQPERYAGLGAMTEVFLRRGEWLDDQQVQQWLDGLTVVYTAEGDYGAPLALRCAQAGVKLVVHANPELWTEGYRDATTTIVCPTGWEVQRIPGATVMPMPVDRARPPFRARTEAARFWHPAAPAFHDRHGTDLVRAALKLVAPRGVTFVVSGMGGQRVRQGRVAVEFVPPRSNYWDGYDECDVLVLPRRYGGLSLPVQEALSSGMPVVMLDTGPYVGRGGVLSVETSDGHDVQMKGGTFRVHTTDPQRLAYEIDDLHLHDQTVRSASLAADETAAELDWGRWKAPWAALLS